MAQVATVGIDIGTTSVKAVAVDGDGHVLASARIAHPLIAGSADELAHDADLAWRHGVLAALDQVAIDGLDIAGVNVAAMVPSLCAVDANGVPISPGLLYGDGRGAHPDPAAGADPSSSGELVRFLAHLAVAHPDAAGFWPAQGVANAALSGIGAIDSVCAMTTLPLFDFIGWDTAVAAEAGVADTARLPRIMSGADAVGRVTHSASPGALLGGGTIDAFAEQLVAGADRDGDVLVILGATLITWAVIPEWVEVAGLWTVPHTAPGKILIGGPSNAGGLFMNWAREMCGIDRRATHGLAARIDPGRVPVWQPYLRGERVPLHDPSRRASLHHLDIGMGPEHALRAAYETSGFAIRHQLDLAGLSPNRIVATGGGTRDAEWISALADASGLEVHCVGVAEGGALGAAYLARVTAGLEPNTAEAGRWASTRQVVEPDPRWQRETGDRYAVYRLLADAGTP